MNHQNARRTTSLCFCLNLIAICVIPARMCMADPESPPAEQAMIRAIQCFDNLRHIDAAIASYATDHDGSYPHDLGSLLIAEKLDMSLFVCPATPNALPPRWQTMPPTAQAAWVNAHTDYIYLGSRWTLASVKPDAPLLYEKEDDHGGAGMNVLFGDGHVQFLPLDTVHQHFGPKAGTERQTTRVKPKPGQPPAKPLITVDQAKAILARADISTLTTALDSFEIDNGRFPTSTEGLKALVEKPAGNLPNWTHPYAQGLPTDPWGHPYVYVCPGRGNDSFDLFSSGPDGKPGTADDVRAEAGGKK